MEPGRKIMDDTRREIRKEDTPNVVEPKQING
jgi:hypothetical protein